MKELKLFNSATKHFFMLSIGANLGDREKTIRDAIDLLSNVEEISISKISSFYETEPVGYADQPWFLNFALCGVTSLKLNVVIQLCKSIEFLLGRKVREQWTEREIDIDLIFYGDTVLESEMLTVPHPRMQDRLFVLVPAEEIAPEYVHPVLKETISELKAKCNDKSTVRLYSSTNKLMN